MERAVFISRGKAAMVAALLMQANPAIANVEVMPVVKRNAHIGYAVQTGTKFGKRDFITEDEAWAI